MICQTIQALFEMGEAAVLKCCEHEKFRLRCFLTILKILEKHFRGMLIFDKAHAIWLNRF